MARTPKKADVGPLFTYDVLSQVEHDLEIYALGDTIELTEAAAAPLLEVKAIAYALRQAEPTE